MTIRAYTSADFDTVAEWAKARDMVLIPQLLSKNGFAVEDDTGLLAVCWCYLTYDCPRAAIDDFYARPGASAWDIKKAWAMMERTIFAFLGNLKDGQGEPIRYAVISTFADADLAAFLKSEGWHVGAKPHFHILKPITYEPS